MSFVLISTLDPGKEPDHTNVYVGPFKSEKLANKHLDEHRQRNPDARAVVVKLTPTKDCP